jgi:hypothetical protein
MEKKQSSIDWLVEEINKQKAWADPSRLEPIIEQAKQMEKEQHEETWAAAWNESAKSGHFEQYYNETFGGNNETH